MTEDDRRMLVAVREMASFVRRPDKIGTMQRLRNRLETLERLERVQKLIEKQMRRSEWLTLNRMAKEIDANETRGRSGSS